MNRNHILLEDLVPYRSLHSAGNTARIVLAYIPLCLVGGERVGNLRGTIKGTAAEFFQQTFL